MTEHQKCAHGIRLTEYCGECFRISVYPAEQAQSVAQTEQFDSVVKPQHYNQGEIECIDAMRAAFGQEALENYCTITAFKYLWRADHKGNRQQDLKKAIWYLRMACGDDPREYRK